MASKCLFRTRVATLGPRWASQSRLLLQLRRSPFSTLPTITGCPSPTCACATTPDLEIDHIKSLHNTVPRHSTHVVVHTNRDDWASRIEDDKETPNIAKELKALLGPKGEFYEVSGLCHITACLRHLLKSTLSKATAGSVMVTNCSSGPAGSVTVFPEGRLFLNLRDFKGVYHDFVRMLLLPEDQRADPPGKLPFRDHVRRDQPSIFICGHGGRDTRCGVMGPLLRDEFETHIKEASFEPKGHRPKVALISHIGGHVFAGNVIIYFPPTQTGHALAGKGIWYGRVEPRHVEGILKETVSKGNVIEELFRGGLDVDGSLLRL